MRCLATVHRQTDRWHHHANSLSYCRA